MQFAVTAMDYTDDGALERRMQYREAHLAGVRRMIAEGRVLSGGGVLDDEGRMVGSSLHLDFPDRETLEACLREDPYTKGKVWERIDIRQVKLVPLP